MAISDNAVLKSYFLNGKEPDENKFGDLIDTFGALSAASVHLLLPGLVGFWPMSGKGSQGGTSQAREFSGSELHLVNSGVQFGELSSWPFTPLVNFGVGGTDRLYRSDESLFQISGTEAQLLVANRGLTAGCWARNTELGNDDHMIMGQWDRSSNQCWRIWQNGASTYTQVSISSTGSDSAGATKGFVASGIADDEWHHYLLQWSPSDQGDFIRLWIDGQIADENTSIGYSSLYNSSANFGIGHGYNSGSPERYFEGQISLAFLCGAKIFDEHITYLYEATKGLFV